MSKRRRRSSRSSRESSSSTGSKRTGLQTAIETSMGVGAAILLVGLSYWWFFVRPTGEGLVQEEVNYAQEAVSDNVIDNEAAYSTILESGNLDNLKKLMVELDAWKRNAPFTVKLDTLNRRIEVAKVILEHNDTDEELRVATARKMLSAFGQFYGISSEEDLPDSDIVGKYLNACNDYVNDENAELAKFAKISKAKVQVYESTGDNNTGSSISIEQTIGDLVTAYPDDPKVLLTARQLIARAGMADVRIAGKLARDIVAKYDALQPQNKDIIRQLRGMKDQILFEDSQVSIVVRDAQSTGNYEPYFAKIDELLTYNDTGVGFVNRIYEAIRFFEAAEQYDLALRVVEKLEATWQDRTDIVAQQQAFRMAKFGRIRNEVVGKKIDFNDIQSNGVPVKSELLEGKPCIIVYYSPNSPDTQDMFNSLNFTYKLLYKTNVRIVAISVEPPTGQSFIEAFDPNWISISSSMQKTSSIFKQCPASHVPYFVVLNGDGVVDSIGVPAGKLKTKIEKIVAGAKMSAGSGSGP